MNVYFISGLCTGCYIFQNIKLPERYNVRCIEWLEPNGDEPLQNYIARLTAPIDTTKPFVLVGLSFGGMICMELNKTLKPVDIILISSVPTYKNIPWLYRLAGLFRLYNFASVWIAQLFRPVIDWIIGAKRSKSEMALLHKTIAQLSPKLLRWSLKQVTLRWRNTTVPKKYFHIHGSADRLLPVGKMRPDVLIESGSHFMVVSHGKQISDVIAQRLSLLD